MIIMPLAHEVQLPLPDNAEAFENIVTDILRVRHENVHLVRLGRSGQAQGGLDGIDALDPKGIVWQATLRQEKVFKKLEDDLAIFDDAGAEQPALFIFATGAARDASLQKEVRAISTARLSEGRCAVEMLFWDDIRKLVASHTDLLARHYSWVKTSADDQAVGKPLRAGLIGFGLGIVVDGSLTEVSEDEWTIEILDYKLGGERDLMAYVERFSALSGAERCVASEFLGVARQIRSSPSVMSGEARVPLGPRRDRKNVHALSLGLKLEDSGDLALTPNGQPAWTSGIEAAAQKIETVLGILPGEIADRPMYGSRCARFYHCGTPRDLLGRLIALEIARIADVRPEEGSALSFIDVVRDVHIPALELTDERLDAVVHLDLAGQGPWTSSLQIFVGDGTELAKVNEAQAARAAFHSTPARTPDTDAALAEVYRLRDEGTASLKGDADPVEAAPLLLKALEIGEANHLDKLGHRVAMNQIRLKAWIASAEAALRTGAFEHLSKARAIVPNDTALNDLAAESDCYDEGWIRFGRFARAAAEYLLGARSDEELHKRARQLHKTSTSPHFVSNETLRVRSDRYWRWDVEFVQWTKLYADAHWPATLRVTDPTGAESTIAIGVSGRQRRAIPIHDAGLELPRLASIYIDIVSEDGPWSQSGPPPLCGNRCSVAQGGVMH